MAAAEYYSGASMHTAPLPIPYNQQQQQQQQTQAPPHRPSLSQNSYSSQSQAPPPYQAIPEQKPSVHFAPSPRPQHQQRLSFSDQAPIPVASHTTSQHLDQQWKQQQHQQQYRPSPVASAAVPIPQPPHRQHLSIPYSPQLSHSQPNYGPPAAPHMRPYTNGNQSQYSLGGYSSDPEPRRRRRRRHSDHKDDREIGGNTRKERSRSTNADGFIGAAGGGLIGDMIFPGLGTVGGALAGWLGGKDYGKHRKHREDKRDKAQHDWERKYRGDSYGEDEHRSHSRERRSYNRHKHEY